MKTLNLLVIFLFLSCTNKEYSKLPFITDAELEPVWISPAEAAYKKIHTVGEFRFINQDSIIVTNRTFDGGIYITDFFFTTCPSICPKMTENMSLLQDKFKTDSRIKFLSHTVAPWIDTVAQLKRYAVEKGITSDRWHLVTGEQADLYSQARHAYFVEGPLGLKKGEDDFLHTENFVLVDTFRRVRGIYNGTSKQDIKRLIEDINTLIVELDLR